LKRWWFEAQGTPYKILLNPRANPGDNLRVLTIRKDAIGAQSFEEQCRLYFSPAAAAAATEQQQQFRK